MSSRLNNHLFHVKDGVVEAIHPTGLDGDIDESEADERELYSRNVDVRALPPSMVYAF